MYMSCGVSYSCPVLLSCTRYLSQICLSPAYVNLRSLSLLIHVLNLFISGGRGGQVGFFVLFLILMLIINPKWVYTESLTVKSDLFVAIDNSGSIKHNENDRKVLELRDDLRIDQDLNQKFNVQFFGFGDNFHSGDSLSFNEGQTNLSKPVEAMSKLNSKAPIILLTDGNQTIGKQVEFATASSPIFPLIVGDTTKTEDIYISRINF